MWIRNRARISKQNAEFAQNRTSYKMKMNDFGDFNFSEWVASGNLGLKLPSASIINQTVIGKSSKFKTKELPPFVGENHIDLIY